MKYKKKGQLENSGKDKSIYVLLNKGLYCLTG